MKEKKKYRSREEAVETVDNFSGGEEGAVSGPEGDNESGDKAASAEEEERRRSPVSEFFISILSGNILSRAEVRRAYPYMIFLSCLAFFYIANVFHSQYLYREHSRLTEDVKELRSRSMTIASQRMIATRQSNVMRELERRNIPLKESLKPNKVIPR